MFRKNLRSLFGFILLVAAPASLLAEMNLDHQLKVTVPFAFSASDKMMPAGEYTISIHPENGTIFIRSEQQNPIILTTIPKESLDRFGRGRLVFQKDGATAVLTEIWARGASTGRMIPYKETKEVNHQKSRSLIYQIP